MKGEHDGRTKRNFFLSNDQLLPRFFVPCSRQTAKSLNFTVFFLPSPIALAKASYSEKSERRGIAVIDELTHFSAAISAALQCVAGSQLPPPLLQSVALVPLQNCNSQSSVAIYKSSG